MSSHKRVNNNNNDDFVSSDEEGYNMDNNDQHQRRAAAAASQSFSSGSEDEPSQQQHQHQQPTHQETTSSVSSLARYQHDDRRSDMEGSEVLDSSSDDGEYQHHDNEHDEDEEDIPTGAIMTREVIGVQQPVVMAAAARGVPPVSGITQMAYGVDSGIQSASTSARREEHHHTSTVQHHQVVRRTSQKSHEINSPHITAAAPITSTSGMTTTMKKTTTTTIKSPRDQIVTSKDQKAQTVVEELKSKEGARIVETRTTTTKQVYAPQYKVSATSVESSVTRGHQGMIGQQHGQQSSTHIVRQSGEASHRHSEMVIHESRNLKTSSSASNQGHQQQSINTAAMERLRKEEKRRRKEEMKKEMMLRESSTTSSTGVTGGSTSNVVISTGSNKTTSKDYIIDNNNNSNAQSSISSNNKTSTTKDQSMTVTVEKKKIREFLPGVDFGFQTEDLRYFTVPSCPGIEMSCSCDLLWKPHHRQELFGAIQLNRKQKLASEPGIEVSSGDGFITGVPNSKGDLLQAQLRLKQSTSFATSCGDGTLRLNSRKQKSTSRTSARPSKNVSLTSGTGKIHHLASNDSSISMASASVGLGGGRIQF